MMNYDLHIHTEYCGHAEGMTVERILRYAEKKRLKTVGISDHIYGPDEKKVPRKIREEATKYKTNCRVLIAAEIDVDGLYDDGRLVVDIPDGLDYVIAGLHYLPGDGRYPRSIEDNHLGPEELINRWRKTLLGVVNTPGITILAHPVRIMATAVDLDKYFVDTLETFSDAAKISAEKGLTWEINELDKRCCRDGYLEKYRRVYRIAADAGVELVYGSDSHTPDTIGKSEFVETILSGLDGVELQTPESIGLISGKK